MYYIYKNNFEYREPMGTNKNSTEIPLKIFETWHTKKLPPKMQECVDKVKHENPEFEYNLYDLDDCRELIEKNFDKEVVKAYDSLIPISYKSDLWRFCVLYVHGGIYLDIKFAPINNFKFISLTDREYYTKDFRGSGRGVLTGFIVSKPKNPKLMDAINGIVDNVKNKYYGNGTLEPTGPLHLKKYFTAEEYDNFDYEYIHDNGLLISKVNGSRKEAILELYKDYRDEQKSNGEKYHADLWLEKSIYRTLE
jgi:mannosyltransferase OCH1-like enzyme